MFDFQFEAARRDSLAADLKLVYSVKESIGLSLYLYLSRYFCISLQFFAGIQFKVEEGRDSPASSCLSRVNRLRGQLCSKLCSAPSCQTQYVHNKSYIHCTISFFFYFDLLKKHYFWSQSEFCFFKLLSQTSLSTKNCFLPFEYLKLKGRV